MDPEELSKKFERNGWKLHGCWISFGDQDAGLVLVVEMPNPIDMASLAIAVRAVGVAVKAVKVTELLSVEEARGALGKASNIQLDQESAEQIASQRDNLMPHVQG